MTATGSTAFALEIQALQKLLADKDAEIERLKGLLTRAADALQEYSSGELPNENSAQLIAELRKATK